MFVKKVFKVSFRSFSSGRNNVYIKKTGQQNYSRAVHLFFVFNLLPFVCIVYILLMTEVPNKNEINSKC
jgi:thiosulfate reductase cytochrome b subunit